jgi:hypothetical protein
MDYFFMRFSARHDGAENPAPSGSGRASGWVIITKTGLIYSIFRKTGLAWEWARKPRVCGLSEE